MIILHAGRNLAAKVKYYADGENPFADVMTVLIIQLLRMFISMTVNLTDTDSNLPHVHMSFLSTATETDLSV